MGSLGEVLSYHESCPHLLLVLFPVCRTHAAQEFGHYGDSHHEELEKLDDFDEEFGDLGVNGNGKHHADDLPEEAARAAEALKLNQQLQRTLKTQLRGVEEAQGRNEVLRKKMQLLLGSKGKNEGPQPVLRKVNSPFFADMRGQTPPDNPDTVRKKKMEGNLPLIFKGRKCMSQSRQSCLPETISHPSELPFF